MEAFIFPIVMIVFIALLLAVYGGDGYDYYSATIIFCGAVNEFEGITYSALEKRQKKKIKNLRQNSQTKKWEIAVDEVSFFEPNKIVWTDIEECVARAILAKEKSGKVSYITVLEQGILLAN
ncbi:MAG: hypothetical protein ABIO57_01110 [Candidatus Paceibacterota bacterium]